MTTNGELAAISNALMHLREQVLRRTVNIDPRAATPEANAIADRAIGDFLLGPDSHEIRSRLARHSVEDKAMTLLVLQCAAALAAVLPEPPRRRPYDRGEATRRRPDLQPIELTD